MRRRDFLRRSAGLAGAAMLGGALGRAAQPTGRPNIIFIYSDDQRADAVGYAGNPVIQTPEMDQLAAEGVVFDNAFVTTPICAVSRANALSGQYARRHGIDDFFKSFSDTQMDALYPSLLRSAGYWTGFIGKWGIAANSEAEMDRVSQWFDFWAGGSYQTNFWHSRTCNFVTYDAVNDKTGNTCDCHPSAGNVRSGYAGIDDPIHQTTEIVPMRVEQFLASCPGDQPFCLSISFKTPHGPWGDWPLELADLYNGDDMPIPETATPADSDAQPQFLRESLEGDRGAELAADHPRLAGLMRHYYRLITAQDRAIGSIRQKLGAAGVADNTVIILMGDHGHFLAEHGFFGKWLLYEESIRTPCLIYDPRLDASMRGTRRDEMVLEIDMAPTMLELAGVPRPSALQGRSLAPLLGGSGLGRRDDFYMEHSYEHGGAIEPSEGLRTERWKYIRYYSQSPVVEQLFDLAADPIERDNLAADPAHAATLADLRARCAAHRAAEGWATGARRANLFSSAAR